MSDFDYCIWLYGLFSAIAAIGIFCYVVAVCVADAYRKFRFNRLEKLKDGGAMKKLILVLVFGFCSIPAKAQTLTNAQAVKVVTPYSFSCSSVTLLAGSSTELTGNTASVLTSSAIYTLRIVPLSQSATAYFDDSVLVSSFGVTIGYPLYPIGSPAAFGQPAPAVFPINTMQKWYGTAGTDGMSVIVCKQK